MKSLLRVISVLFFCLSILSCTSAPKNIADEGVLDGETGVLVVGLHTNWKGHSNPLLADLKIQYDKKEGSKKLFGRHMSFKGEDYVHVITLPAGEYNARRLVFGNRELMFSEISGFTIELNKINYIGDFFVELDLSLFSASAVVEVKEQFEDTMKQVSLDYPNYTNQYEAIESIAILQTYFRQ